MAEKTYRPGQDVPNPGIYQVTHSGHRDGHEVLIVDGRFPRCRICGDGVTFALVRLATPIDGDSDFRTGHPM
jgi:hypothetical protein